MSFKIHNLAKTLLVQSNHLLKCSDFSNYNQNNMKLINTFTLLALCLFSNIAYNQELPDIINVTPENFTLNQRNMLGRKHIKELKEGVLIFRLKTNDKALKKLQSILDNPKTNDSSKQRIRERTMPDLKASAETQNNKLKSAFAEAYDFSAVYFMPDTCTYSLQNDLPLTCLSDAEGNPLAADAIKHKNIFIVDFSELENDKTSRIKGLIISDKNTNRLMPPFPYFQRSGGVFVKLSSNTITPKDALKMVTRWNSRLHNFFEEEKQ